MGIAKIKKVAVIGGGTVGPGIAHSYAQGECEVCLCDISEEAIDRARSVVEVNLQTLVENHMLAASDVEGVKKRISYGTQLEEAVIQADLVVECITENLTLKGDLFRQLDEICPEQTLFASNTSYLNIFQVMPERRLSNTVIAHWFAPPHIIPLVEVVKGPKSSDATVEVVMEMLKALGKIPVLIERYVPGFAINRILRILGRETFFLLDNGYITAEQLDLAVKASLAPRMMLLGLVQRYDFTGLDLSARNLENPDYLEPPIDNRPRSLFDLVEKGHLGVKTGKGFFDYTDQPLEETLRQRDDKLLKILQSTDFCFKEKIGK
ncbi:MAG: 3-hydroxyacyl-CoA dehydrogenase family protein [Desulfobacteraceae bacterium]|nr:3-hydroxyacyl-CoA dehydrogenase family protein [Desulfobacteraceae bacterium]